MKRTLKGAAVLALASSMLAATSLSKAEDAERLWPGQSGPVFYRFCTTGGGTRMEGGGAAMHRIAMPLYVSDVFVVPQDKVTHPEVDFADFVGEKYDPHFKKSTDPTAARHEKRAFCRGNATTPEEARKEKQQMEDSYRRNARSSPSDYPNSKIVETGWKWGGSE